MSLELLGIVIDTILASAVVFFIIWDHVKDDRILTNQVQEFFRTVESLIYTYYHFQFYKTYFSIDYILKIEDKRFDKFKKINYKDLDHKFSQRMFYLSEKMRRGIKEWGKYIGIIPNFEIKEDMSEDNKDSFSKIKYYSDTNLIITYQGEILNHLGKPLVQDSNSITEKEGFVIFYFLRSLKKYWKINYRKFLLRRKLRGKLNMTGLFFDYEQVRERINNKRFDSLFRLTNIILEQIKDLLRGTIVTSKIIF